ncbi:MAG: hypothetical protein KC713_08745 [Candidatus Omnitrophica bacterium]|nr:hypothetical protein [Candidatus Omnitrophota bacterium]
MNKIRHIDNKVAKWIMRHFYLTFFQIVLAIIFMVWFMSALDIIDLNFSASSSSITDRILLSQATNANIIVFLLILNSFWLLFIFGSIQRLKTTLKDIHFGILRLKKNNIR